MDYCAIIGDIVNSRKIKNRVDVQEKFIYVVECSINKEFHPYIASKFTITLGDEFQGLLYKEYTYKSYEIVKFISEKMKPIKLVYGIGVGQIDIKPNLHLAIGSDGPAYHRARNMINKAKYKKPSICYDIGGRESELINSLIYLIEANIEKMTSRQQEIIGLYNELKSQYKVAEILKINQSTVSKILKNASYHMIEHAEKSIIEFLKQEELI